MTSKNVVKDNKTPVQKISKKARRYKDEEAWDVAAFVNSQPRPKKKNN